MTNEKTAKEKESRYQINKLEAGGGIGKGRESGWKQHQKEEEEEEVVGDCFSSSEMLIQETRCNFSHRLFPPFRCVSNDDLL